jgi:hypothetical protein
MSNTHDMHEINDISTAGASQCSRRSVGKSIARNLEFVSHLEIGIVSIAMLGFVLILVEYPFNLST